MAEHEKVSRACLVRWKESGLIRPLRTKLVTAYHCLDEDRYLILDQSLSIIKSSIRMLFVLDEWKNWVEAESKENQTKIGCIFFYCEYNSNWTSMTSNKVEVVFPL